MDDPVPVRGVLDLTGQHFTEGGGLIAFQGGVRVGPQKRNAMTPFGQALIGFAVLGGGGEAYGAWVTQFGGGVDIRSRSGGPALRLGVDMPIFFNDGGHLIGLRSTVGIVFNP